MIVNHDSEEECVFISMTNEEASRCYDALAEALERSSRQMSHKHRDAITDLKSCVNVE